MLASRRRSVASGGSGAAAPSSPVSDGEAGKADVGTHLSRKRHKIFDANQIAFPNDELEGNRPRLFA